MLRVTGDVLRDQDAALDGRVNSPESSLLWCSVTGGASRVGSARPRNIVSFPSRQSAASLADTRAKAAPEARRRLGCRLASSQSRAASFTGSPITVYSSRRSAPMFPATAAPAEIPVPDSSSGSSRRRRSRRVDSAGESHTILAVVPGEITRMKGRRLAGGLSRDLSLEARAPLRALSAAALGLASASHSHGVLGGSPIGHRASRGPFRVHQPCP